jgi:uncharacterized protein YjbJ (UPF0337 family)
MLHAPENFTWRPVAVVRCAAVAIANECRMSGHRNPLMSLPLTHSQLRPLKEIGVMAGTTDKVKGSLKEAAGKATGDKRRESEGKVDRAKGEVKDAAHRVKETSKGARDSLKKS